MLSDFPPSFRQNSKCGKLPPPRTSTEGREGQTVIQRRRQQMKEQTDSLARATRRENEGLAVKPRLSSSCRGPGGLALGLQTHSCGTFLCETFTNFPNEKQIAICLFSHRLPNLAGCNLNAVNCRPNSSQTFQSWLKEIT